MPMSKWMIPKFFCFVDFFLHVWLQPFFYFLKVLFHHTCSYNCIIQIFSCFAHFLFAFSNFSLNVSGQLLPFNHYGKSKLEAESVIKDWYSQEPENRSVTIIRPTVIFGERNRGNVFNLISQICSRKFIMIGNGLNKKSMAYVGNVVAFIKTRFFSLSFFPVW